ncbi:hypothetical protein FRC98_07940 [Lujinxingia vulgaris]|uniref:NAD glycohydrolase translocation F5/8 type C domain-containing protein n=1 Tax=Lujinxingia vulgaris TaxID=2600176 RepID=A0A5C6XCX1_9DELT|nr:HEAT repeat domain-containing protein [Lujinxingia vulgaris]TXD37611.1 hypothetical protein FRC98_07940 [Lujinxingia vulgaris]
MFTSPSGAPSPLRVLPILRGAPAASALLTSALIALGAQPVSAQISAPERIERHSETIELERRRPALQLNIYQRADADERIWNVELAGGPGRTSAICRTTFPREVGQNFYIFEIQSRKLTSTGHAIILEARADYQRGPLDPPVYQVAMWVDRANSSTGWSCGVIGRGEYTRLDGGASLGFRQLSPEDAPDTTTLVRADRTRGPSFCGLQKEEDRGFEIFDPDQGRFVAGDRIDLQLEQAIDLEATLPERAYRIPLTANIFSWALASSDVRGAPVGGLPARPISLGDADLKTAWIEGSGEGGVGEYVSANVTTAVPIRGLHIFPGHGRSRDHFESYARPTELLIGLSDGLRFRVALPDVSTDDLFESGGLTVTFPEPVYTNCLSAMILDSQPGAMAEAPEAERRRLGRSVAISELTLTSTVDAPTEDETARRIVHEVVLEPQAPRRDQLSRMTTRIPSATITAVDEVLRGDDPTARDRAVPMLASLPSDEAVPTLMAHLKRVHTDAPDYRATQRAIAAHGARAADPLLDLLDQLDPTERKYVDAVRLIGRLGSLIQLGRLIDTFGQGPDRLRNERVRAVAAGGVAMLPRLIDAAQVSPDSPTTEDTLQAIGLIARRDFAHETGELEDVDALLDLARTSQVRRHRLRAIEALGYFLHPEGVEHLSDLLVEDPDPLIRAAAAGALTRYPGDEARQALTGALQDNSPDVRIAAIGALGARDDAAPSTPEIIDYVERERWHTGLHRGLDVLAASAHPEALPYLERLLVEHPNGERVPVALRALRHHRRPVSRQAIDQAMAVPGLRASVLRQLVSMLGMHDGPDIDAELLNIARGTHPTVAATFTEDPSLAGELRRQALNAMGTRRSAEGRANLLAFVVDDEAPEDLRIAALQALAFFADPTLVEELQELATTLPRPLRPQLRDTLAQIQARVAIDDAGDDIQEFRDALDEREKRRLSDEKSNR